MIIKIFKISTKEMWTIPGKKFLLKFIKQETGIAPPSDLTIKQLIKYLPVEDYDRVR